MLLENTLFSLIGLKNVEKSVSNLGVVFLHQGTQISSFHSPVRDFSDVSSSLGCVLFNYIADPIITELREFHNHRSVNI